MQAAEIQTISVFSKLPASTEEYGKISVKKERYL
jgi:hypothetical protein